MKKRIVLGLAAFTAVFVLGGIYLIITIENATSTLNNLIELHRVELLREQLLMNARRIQSVLEMKDVPSEPMLDSLVGHIAGMENQANRCLECHHNEQITRELSDLKGQIYVYEGALQKFLAARGNAARREIEAGKASEVGITLLKMLHDMTALTHARLDKRTQATLATISDMKTMIFIVIVLGPIVAIGMAVVFTRGLARPLSVLLQATRKLTSGDLSYRVYGLTDEFGEMAAAINEMAAAINEQVNRMRRAEQMTMVGEMAAGLVHEIKNPLAGIKGAMQVFQEAAGISEADRAILSQAIDEVERVETLMKNLLNFAKPPKPQLLRVNINDVLEATINASNPYSAGGPDSPMAIRIVKHFDPGLPMTMVDPMEMQQVFLNLLMNAMQAMPHGGTVTVTTFEDGETKDIHVEIADTGTGVTDELREKVFKPFFTTKRKGTGLGLPISKQFIEMHGGRISVENNPEGGATFRIILPGARTDGGPHNVPQQETG